jgi:hypothetical protein
MLGFKVRPRLGDKAVSLRLVYPAKMQFEIRILDLVPTEALGLSQ